MVVLLDVGDIILRLVVGVGTVTLISVEGVVTNPVLKIKYSLLTSLTTKACETTQLLSY